jgi:prophage antirepressor-like protein
MSNIRVEVWNGHEIRFVEKAQGDWWGIAVDVCKALGIKNVSMAVNGNPKTKNRGLPESQKGVIKHYTPGGEQEMLVVNEPGIYRLIFRSNKPEAEAFQEWVFEMLRTLRQSTGLEGFQIFRMLDKEHQRATMDKLKASLQNPVKVDFIKANTITNKAVSSMFGYPKSVKKEAMTPDMLVQRQQILDDTVNLMGCVEKFGLDVSVSKTVYGKYASG